MGQDPAQRIAGTSSKPLTRCKMVVAQKIHKLHLKEMDREKHLHWEEDTHQEDLAALEKQEDLHQENVAGLEEGRVTL